MNRLRLLLLPFSVLYLLITEVRNMLYNVGILRSYKIPKRSIVVGNLSTGGTGKTPTVDYILSFFIESGVQSASLSRGYGRKTKGVLFADKQSNSNSIGDEPMVYFLRFGNYIPVVVAEKRKEGVEAIYNKYPDTELIVLDDAFQHRAVSAGLNILITEYQNLYSDDFPLPAGNLRESKSGIKRADILIVSKCPADISSEDKRKLVRKLKFHNENIFFSSIKYGELMNFNKQVSPVAENILLVTGIGNPSPLLNYLSERANIVHLPFPDHHNFSLADIRQIHEKFDTFASRDKMIVTTEKDYMRLTGFEEVFTSEYPWFYQPIAITIDQEEKFNTLLEAYVGKI